jgi:hypothetical protein
MDLKRVTIPAESRVEVDFVQCTDTSATCICEQPGMQKHHSGDEIQSLREMMVMNNEAGKMNNP